MKILVTGGAGFIGSHIVDALVEQDHEVVVIDNFSNGRATNINHKANYLDLDIMDDRLSEVFETVCPQIVIHHAAQASVQKSVKQPLADAKTNVLGTVAILEQCVKSAVEKIIFASTAAVYGTPQYLGIDEKHPVNPLSPYAVSKFTSEQYVKLYSNMYGLDYTILRYANVYGMRQDTEGEGGVVSNFMRKMLKKKPPVIFGDGEQTRDFIYVKDVVTANLAALTKGSKGVYNISCNQQTSINQLSNILMEMFGDSMSPDYAAPRQGDIEHSFLDNRRAEEELGWKPLYRLRDGLAETFEYYAGQIALHQR